MDVRQSTVDLELSPLDNRALANLCGALDANLRQIEAALDVTIARRGASFTLRGAAPQIERAATALERFYSQAKEPLTVDDIQLGLIELGGTRAPEGASAEAAGGESTIHAGQCSVARRCLGGCGWCAGPGLEHDQDNACKSKDKPDGDG